MARLIPSTLAGKTPSLGEERLFAYLKRHLQPDADHWVWFRPEVRVSAQVVHRPAFVALGPRFGLLALELCDWLPGSIGRLGARSARVRATDGSVQTLPGPQRVAAEGAQALATVLSRTPGLAHTEGLLAGNLVVPINSGVVFANLPLKELRALERAGGSLRAEAALSRDDLALTGEAAEKRLRLIFGRMYVEKFPFRIDDELRERIRVAIEPQLHFFDFRDAGWEEWAEEEADAAAPDISPESYAEPEEQDWEDEDLDEVESWDFEIPDDDEEIEEPEAYEPPELTVVELPVPPRPVTAAMPGFTLDSKQERMARELASPRTLVYGPAGSGKTVFLISRARYWVQYKPESRVLFTCYNSSLASYLRKAFALRGLPPDGERLTVHHYHELLSRLLDLGDIHDRGEDFYASLEPRILQEMARREDLPSFDLILVDEGQDFDRRMLEVLVRLLNDGGEITVVCDPAQDIYRRWSADNLAPLRDVSVEHLVDVYRNTAPIFALASAVLTAEDRHTLGLDRLEMTRPEDVGRLGPAPELVQLTSLDDLAQRIVTLAGEFRAQGIPLSQLAVLYADRGAIPDFAARLPESHWVVAADARFLEPLDPDEENPSGHFAEALERELMARGVPAEWVARDFASKAAYDIGRDRLTVSTVHSVKGLDFHTVILLGAETLSRAPGWSGDRAASLLFTGITRARERLLFPYFNEGGWIPELKQKIADLEVPVE